MMNGFLQRLIEDVSWEVNLDARLSRQHKADVVRKAAEELAALEAVAEAARTGKGLDDALDALDALKGAE